jgi:hypothetical protein
LAHSINVLFTVRIIVVVGAIDVPIAPIAPTMPYSRTVLATRVATSSTRRYEYYKYQILQYSSTLLLEYGVLVVATRST